MALNIHRTLPPAASPFSGRTLLDGFGAVLRHSDTVDEFRHSIGLFFDQPNSFLVSSGAAALTLILKAMRKMHPGRNRVMVPAYTCYSVPAAIKRAGLTIHPVDICPETLDFDEQQLAEQIERHQSETLAVVPTHLFGIASNVDRIRGYINDKAVLIVEDAAQALGASCPNGRIGLLGDVGFFSLGRGKALSTMGGGVILTGNTSLAESISNTVAQINGVSPGKLVQLVCETLFTQMFSRPELFWLPKALPFLRLGETIYNPLFGIHKLSSFQAGLSTRWQERLEKLQAQREYNAVHWNKLTCLLSVETPQMDPEQLSSLIRYPIYIPDRSKLKELLSENRKYGLGIMPGYPNAITRIRQLKEELAGFNCDNAILVAGQLVTLPTHGWVTAVDRNRIAAALTKAAATR